MKIDSTNSKTLSVTLHKEDYSKLNFSHSSDAKTLDSGEDSVHACIFLSSRNLTTMHKTLGNQASLVSLVTGKLVKCRFCLYFWLCAIHIYMKQRELTKKI